MKGILQRLFQSYHYINDEISDHRTKNWWLIEGYGPIITILVSYLFFCCYLGPRYMRDRKPYTLKYLILIHNQFQIVLSVFLAYRGLDFLLSNDYNGTIGCYDVDYSDSPMALKGANSIWWYFFAKILELLDTVFFVLRKKSNQVSSLHLFHHTTMPILAWLAAKYAPGGQCIPEGGLNSFIHIIMYSYYIVAILGPQYQKYLSWKKYVTILQLIQFLIIFFFNATSFFNQTCGYPKFLNIFVIVNTLTFLVMFSRFYLKTYSDRGKKIKLENNSRNLTNCKYCSVNKAI